MASRDATLGRLFCWYGMKISGAIVFVDTVDRVSAGALRVSLQDVSKTDGSATILAEVVIGGISVSTSGESIPFALAVPALDPGGIYSIDAHLDLTGSGEITAGDFVTTEHFPVNPRIESQHVTVCIRQI